MLLMFDTMGRRYSKLPSEILRTADSFDLMVMDVAHTYEQYLDAKANNKNIDQFMDKDEMKHIFDKATGKEE